jgi:membrane fusion protein (multidrug efflux system)
MKNLLLLVSVLALLHLTSCNTEVSEAHSRVEDATYFATNPLHKDTSIVKEYVCQIQAYRHIELRALEKGYLQHIYVDEGQSINKGQKMFQILPNVYNAEKQKAQAELNFTKIEYKNTKMLFDNNIVSENELALVEAKLQKAKADLQLADVHLSFTQINAPFSGIMDRFQVREGSLLDEGELLTTLSDNSEMWVYFNVPEAEYLDYMTNKVDNKELEVQLKMANHKIFDHLGYVKTIEADFNNETGNIAFRATFPNSKGLLRHGETGTIQINQALNNTLLIPQKATFEVLDKKYVYVIDKNNTIKSRQVTIAAELPHLYAITNGLKSDDKILLEGLRKVKENDKVNYNFLKPDSVMSNLDLYAE